MPARATGAHNDEKDLKHKLFNLNFAVEDTYKDRHLGDKCD